MAGKATEKSVKVSKKTAVKRVAAKPTVGDWRAETLARMRALILDADSEMVEEVKWRKPSNGMAGVPVWSHHGIVCTGETYSKVVKLTFAKGARLPDPARLFNASLEGNTRRAIDIHEGENINATAFKKLIKAAVSANDSSRPRRVGPAAHRRAGPPSSTMNMDGGSALEASLSHPTASRAKRPKSSELPKNEQGVVLLSGGNPQIAKGDGDAPVQAYIAAMPGWKREIGKRLDELIVRTVPNVRKAVKWNTPFYGIEGQGWFLGFHCITKYIKVAFFRGTSLRPLPPVESKQMEVRYLHIHEGEFDEAPLKAWVKQAAALPGWVP